MRQCSQRMVAWSRSRLLGAVGRRRSRRCGSSASPASTRPAPRRSTTASASSRPGRARRSNILVLNPGTSASAAYFEPLAKTIVPSGPDWQVWAVERRENLLEDQSMLDKPARRARRRPQQVFDYYLGYLPNPSITTHFQLIPDSDVGYARQWGMNTEIQDLRRSCSRPSGLGRTVVVGGHSLGGSITTAYATWDFNGKAGADGLSGLVFIDGGSARRRCTAAAARSRSQKPADELAVADLRRHRRRRTRACSDSPARSARCRTRTRRRSARPFPLLPANLKPPIPVTNAGQYGYALNVETSPPLAGRRAGTPRPASGLSTTPAGWDNDDGLTPIQRYATMFAGQGVQGLDGVAWYHPMRLTIDARRRAPTATPTRRRRCSTCTRPTATRCRRP